MSPPRTATLAAVLTALLAAPAVRGDPACTARLEMAPGVPPRVAASLRSQLAALPAGGACGALTFRWSRSRLVIEVALDDGRAARRTLASLHDALPTVLALLATPPIETVATTPPAAPEVLPVGVPVPVEPAPRVAAAPPPPVSAMPEPRWRLRAGGGLGVAWSEGQWFFTQRAGLDLVRGSVVVGLHGQWSRGGDEEAGTGVREQVWGASARWQISLQRWRFELGGLFAFGTRAPDVEGRDNNRMRPTWLFRTGADLAAAFQITGGLSTFARVEALGTFAHLGVDPKVGSTPFSASVTFGLRMEIGL